MPNASYGCNYKGIPDCNYLATLAMPRYLITIAIMMILTLRLYNYDLLKNL